MIILTEAMVSSWIFFFLTTAGVVDLQRLHVLAHMYTHLFDPYPAFCYHLPLLIRRLNLSQAQLWLCNAKNC